MSFSCPLENRDDRELIVCESEQARQAHRELFRFSDIHYLTATEPGKVFEAIVGVVAGCNSRTSVCPSKIDVVVSWENLLKLSLWQEARPTASDVLIFLRVMGISSHELEPFKTSDLDDFFPWLYYGKRLDILRRICHTAKRKIESHLKNLSVRVNCHIIAEDTRKIVASSL